MVSIPVQSWLSVPEWRPADVYVLEAVKGIFFDGPEYASRPTRTFAWYGAPVGPGPFPAVMLVHGGGGTAFADWVRLWNDRGYAAMAVDTCGGVPCWTPSPFSSNQWPRHSHSGPNGWGVDCAHPDAAPDQQWAYHALASVMLGTSLLASFPEVDARRIGITGVSWGAVLTAMAAGLDRRFRCAVPVYGCGFLDYPESALHGDAPLNFPAVRQWLDRWDPKHFLPAMDRPILWMNGTNDFAFPLCATMDSARATPGESLFCLPVRMPHGHGGIAERAPEIAAMMDWVLRDAPRPPKLGLPAIADGKLRAGYTCGKDIRSAELAYTRAGGYWTDRLWNTTAATIDKAAGHVCASLPGGATAAYFSVTDIEGNLWSTPLFTARLTD